MKPKITMKRTYELFIHLLNSNVILPDFKFDDMINCSVALIKQVPMHSKGDNKNDCYDIQTR